MADSFLVYEYSRHTVRCVVSQATGQLIAEIADKAHLNYILGRLEAAEVKTLVAETQYVDRDYLSDYAHFHARSFQSYERFCTRIHFFRRSFTPSMFESLVTGLGFEEANIQGLRDDYLGFMVVRPLARFIGRTCLRLPTSEGWHAPMRHRYSAGLFGIDLDVPATVAFQEQDNVLAACATCAVWFTLHAKSDRELIPSPGSITRQAMRDDGVHRRAFPTSGLHVDEILRALKREHYEVVLNDFSPSSAGPVPEWSPDIDMREAKRVIYAYLRGGVSAPILGVALFERGSENSFAHHAITVVGYHLGKGGTASPAISTDQGRPTTPRLLADDLDGFLVHDDKAGPFCETKIVPEDKPLRLQLDGKPVDVNMTLAHPLAELNQGRVGGKDPAKIFQIISVVALATYHKIRLQLPGVIHYVHQFEGYIHQLAPSIPETADRLRSMVFGDGQQGFIWDVYIADSTSMKRDVRDTFKAHGQYPDESKRRLIAEVVAPGWPHYVWRATAYSVGKDAPVFDLIIDSTDTVHPGSLIKAVFYSPESEQTFRELLVQPGDEETSPADTSVLIKSLIRQFVPLPRIQEADADIRYGRPHPPRMIKRHEVGKNQQRLPYTRERCFSLSHSFGNPATPGTHGDDDERLERIHRLQSFLKEKQGNSSPCLWLIDKYCNVVLAEETPCLDNSADGLGHPTLVGGEPARISGEFKWDRAQGSWILTNESGRYSRLQPDRGRKQLKAAADLLERRLLDIGEEAKSRGSIWEEVKIRDVWKEEYGPELIRNSQTATKAISDLPPGRDFREQLSLVRDWARDIVNKSGDGAIIPELVCGLLKVALAPLDRKTLLTMGFLHQLWDLRPDALDSSHVEILVPHVDKAVKRIGFPDGDSDEEKCKREVLTALCVVLSAKNGAMLDALKIATDWQLPEQLRAIAKRARDTLGDNSHAPVA